MVTVIPYELQPIGAFSMTCSIYDEEMVPGSINLCLLPPPPPTAPLQKPGVLADLGWRNHRVMFQAQIQAGTLDEELTSTQYIVVKTSYIDMSSRFTAPHCFCCYQAINSRAGMNWLTLRVASVASCNLIPYIISPSCFLLLFFFISPQTCLLSHETCIYIHFSKLKIIGVATKYNLVEIICCNSSNSVVHGQVALTQMQLWRSGGRSLFLTFHHCS